MRSGAQVATHLGEVVHVALDVGPAVLDGKCPVLLHPRRHQDAAVARVEPGEVDGRRAEVQGVGGVWEARSEEGDAPGGGGVGVVRSLGRDFWVG